MCGEEAGVVRGRWHIRLDNKMSIFKLENGGIAIAQGDDGEFREEALGPTLQS